jgi:hypothetical protein
MRLYIKVGWLNNASPLILNFDDIKYWRIRMKFTFGWFFSNLIKLMTCTKSSNGWNYVTLKKFNMDEIGPIGGISCNKDKL